MSAIRGVLAALILGAGWWLPVGARAELPPAPVDDVEDLLLFTRPHPLLIRVHLRIGEQTLHEAWRRAVARLHRHLDRDGDQLLNASEISRLELIRLRRAFGTLAANETRLSLLAPGDPLRDGAVTTDELAALVRSFRRPLVVEAPARTGEEQDPTFTRLDADHDGTLSRGEMGRAADVLRGLDQNDDDVISRDELVPFQNPLIPVNAGQTPRQTPAPTVVNANAFSTRNDLAQAVMNRFDTSGRRGVRAKDQRLERTEIGLDPVRFDALDRDSDETLDLAELTGFLDWSRPDLELIVRLGPPSIYHYSVELVDAPAREGDGSELVRVLRTSDKIMTIALGHLRVDVQTETVTESFNTTRARAQAVFRRLDRDENKSVTIVEAQNEELFRSNFGLLDQNDDNHVDLDELNAGLALLEEVSQGVGTLEVADHGVLVFGNLDTNNDDRLSLRELRTASQRLQAFDQDGDGALAGNEIPHRFAWSFSRRIMPPRATPPAATKLVVTPNAPSSQPVNWFEKMDRNRDGDLSPREFFGPRTAFDRLDRDGDGLIDADEARAEPRP